MRLKFNITTFFGFIFTLTMSAVLTYSFVDAAAFMKLGDIKGEAMDTSGNAVLNGECSWCDEITIQITNTEAELARTETERETADEPELQALDLKIAELNQDLVDWKSDQALCLQLYCPAPGTDESEIKRSIVVPYVLEKCADCDALYNEIEAHRDLIYQSSVSGVRVEKAELLEKLLMKEREYAQHCLPGDDRRGARENLCQYNESDFDFVCRMCDARSAQDIREIEARLQIIQDEAEKERLEAHLKILREEQASCWVRCVQDPGYEDESCENIRQKLEVENAQKIRLLEEGGDSTEINHQEYLVTQLELAVNDSCPMREENIKNRDAGSGMVSGKRQHSPFKLTMPSLEECESYEDKHKEWINLLSVSMQGQLSLEEEEEMMQAQMYVSGCQKFWREYVLKDCPDCSVIQNQMSRYENWRIEIAGRIRAEFDEKASLDFSVSEEAVLEVTTLRLIDRELLNLRERLAKCLKVREESPQVCPLAIQPECPSCQTYKEDLEILDVMAHELTHVVQQSAARIMDNALVAVLPVLQDQIVAKYDSLNLLSMEQLSLNFEKIAWIYQRLSDARIAYDRCLQNNKRLSEVGLCPVETASYPAEPYCFDCATLADGVAERKGNVEYEWKIEKGEKMMSHDTAMNSIRNMKALFGEDDGNGAYESCLEYQARLQDQGFCAEEEQIDRPELTESCPQCHMIAKELQELIDRKFYLIERGRTAELREIVLKISRLRGQLSKCLNKASPLRASGQCPDDVPTSRPKPLDIDSVDKEALAGDSFFDVFVDLKTDNNNADAIAYLQRNGIVKGNPDGTFKSESGVNRAELAKIVVLAVLGEDPDPSAYQGCFPDVKDEWFARYVCYALEQGWVNGYPDGTFKPSNPSNKVEALKIILEVFGYGPDLSEASGSSLFDDLDMNAWYYIYLHFAMQNDLLDDIDNNFFPNNEMTRGGMSEIMYRLMLLRKSGDLSFE